LHFRRLLLLRAAELSESTVEALNGHKLVAFALQARALIETVAAAVYFEHQLSPLIHATPMDATAVRAALRQAHLGTRFDWRRLFDAAGDRREALQAYASTTPDPAADLAVNIRTMVSRLATRLGNLTHDAGAHANFTYAILSDIAHPALGSHLIYQQSIHPLLSASREPHELTLLGLTEIVLPSLAVVVSTMRPCLMELQLLADILETPPAPSGPSPTT
jgi:hypothetical protein